MAMTAGLFIMAASLVLQAPAAQQPVAEPTIEQRLRERAGENVHPLAFDGSVFSGPGWDLLVSEGRAAEFVLLGEEHGTAEIPVLSREIFRALRPAGFDKLVIELSPPVAEQLDEAAKAGLEGLRTYMEAAPPGPAFYSWRHEAELLAAVRAMVPHSARALWGTDYEVLGERTLIRSLMESAPASARPALDALDQASVTAREKARAESNPEALLMFSGNPALVAAVREAWPDPDAANALILDTLAETMAINQLMRESGWRSNERRAQFNRAQMVRLLAAEEAPAAGPASW